MKIRALIEKLERMGGDTNVSVACNESMDVVYDEVCVERLNSKVVLFGLKGSEDF